MPLPTPPGFNRMMKMIKKLFKSLLKPPKAAATLHYQDVAKAPRLAHAPDVLREDGDPVDVLVLMDEPAYPGCLIKCRPVGIIEGEQGKNKKDTERNDRVVAIELMNHTYAHVKHVDDLGKTFVRELEEFFINYHELSGKQYRVLDVRGPGEARRRIKDGMRAVNKK